MIDRIEGIQRISYNTTKILPIRPYSKEEQKKIIAEINRLAEEYSNFNNQVNNEPDNSSFKELLTKAMESIHLENKSNSQDLKDSSFDGGKNLV
ncbi:MAG: hypothetical protein UH788_05880 [Treponemataceae bacterium]|nr:hypothetical protein [Treponemataceae bacterium]